MVKLGETRLFGKKEYVYCAFQDVPSNGRIVRCQAWTPIPDGMTALDLGRKFDAALMTTEVLTANEWTKEC